MINTKPSIADCSCLLLLLTELSDLTFLKRLDEIGEDKLHGLARRVVCNYWVARLLQVAVRAHDSDDRDARLARLLHRMLLVLRIDNEECIRTLSHSRNPVETCLKTCLLATNHHELELGVLLDECARR